MGGNRVGVLRKISDVIDKVCSFVSITILAAMTIMYFSAIVSRYIIGSGFRGSEEFTRYGMIWLIYISAILITKNGEHLNVSVMENLLGERSRKYLIFIQRLLMIVYLGVMFAVSLQMVDIGSLQTSPNMNIPMNYVYGIFPAAFALMVVQLIFTAIRDLLAGSGGTALKAE